MKGNTEEGRKDVRMLAVLVNKKGNKAFYEIIDGGRREGGKGGGRVKRRGAVKEAFGISMFPLVSSPFL